MDKTELIMRRRTVRAFILADPIRELVVTRKQPSVKNPNTGGYVAQPDVTLPVQKNKARVIQNVRRYTAGVENSEAGDIPNSEYRLVGLHTLDLEVDDVFQYRGETYRVTGIHHARIESIFAAVDLLGKKNHG